MEIASQIGLKAPKRCIKTMVIGIISLKTTNKWFFDNPGHFIWQPFLVSSQPILDFLEPWPQLSLLYVSSVTVETFSPYAEVGGTMVTGWIYNGSYTAILLYSQWGGGLD